MISAIKKYLLVFCTALLFATVCFGQKSTSESGAPIYTADSLASGNFKDILTSFYQLAFNNLTGPDKELNFNSNPYAIMLRNNPKLAIDRDYYRYRVLRKLNFGFGIRLDTSYRFNGFSSGIKYALINKRDSTTSKFLFNSLKMDSLNVDVKTLEDKAADFLDANFPATDSNGQSIPGNVLRRKEFKRNFDKLRSFSPYISYNTLDAGFRNFIETIATENNLNTFLTTIKSDSTLSIQQKLDERFSNMKTAIKNDLLWTVGISDTTYKDQFLFSNILLSTELSKGIFKARPGSNLELNIKAAVNFIDDSLRTGRDLKRSIFLFEPGINWVIRDRSNDHSLFEFKLGGSYSHNFAQLYQDEKRDVLMFEGTLRVRIFADIWVPLEFKYDPDKGNWFGFLNVRANFTGLGKLLKG